MLKSNTSESFNNSKSQLKGIPSQTKVKRNLSKDNLIQISYENLKLKEKELFGEFKLLCEENAFYKAKDLDCEVEVLYASLIKNPLNIIFLIIIIVHLISK